MTIVEVYLGQIWDTPHLTPHLRPLCNTTYFNYVYITQIPGEYIINYISLLIISNYGIGVV